MVARAANVEEVPMSSTDCMWHMGIDIGAESGGWGETDLPILACKFG